MSLGKRLRQFRDSAGYTREDVASLLKVSFSIVEKWESDRRRPPLAKAEKLAVLYGTTVSELVGDTLRTVREEKNEMLAKAEKYSDLINALESMDDDQRDFFIKRATSVAAAFPKDAPMLYQKTGKS